MQELEMSEKSPAPPTHDDETQSSSAVAPPDTVEVGAIFEPPAETRIAAPFHILSEVKAQHREQIAQARARTPQEKVESAKNDGRTEQGSMLVMAPIKGGQTEYNKLKDLLEALGKSTDAYDLEVNPIIPFAHLTTLHFARFVMHAPSPSSEAPVPVYPVPDGKPQAHGPPISAKLLFATDFDGSLDVHVDELIRVAGPGLNMIFSYCEGWPETDDPRAVRDFFTRHMVPSNTFYTGTMHRSVDQVHREEALHQAIEKWLNENEGTLGTDPVQIRSRIRDWVFGQSEFAWAKMQPGPFPSPLFNPDNLGKVVERAGVALLVGLFLVLRLVTGGWVAAALWTVGIVAVLVAAGYSAWRFLRRLEDTDPVIILNKPIKELLTAEDRIVQNQMSSVIYIKEPLWFRGFVLRTVLAVINVLAKYFSNTGTLAGIPSIHFARWVIVDNGRRLVFFSNFDGSWENYLGDFIDKSASGLTAVWSNCVGFPRTKGLTGEGARDEQKFKAYSRDSQIPTQVWYSAYRWLSVDNINNNSKIRLGLYGDMTADEAGVWVRRFGGSTNVDNTGPALAPASKVRQPEPRVEREDMQGLVIRSYYPLKHADYVTVYFRGQDGTPASREQVRAWIAAMEKVVTRGDRRTSEVEKDGFARNMALTYSGIQKIGLDSDTLQSFGEEFRDGMASAYRSRILGDNGNSDPGTWIWGGPGDQVDAMIFVYANTPEHLEALVNEESARATGSGISLGKRLGSIMLAEDKEHFGFHDGIAQPRIAGFGKPDDDEAPSPTEPIVPAGEVVLGYTNAYGQIPLTPTAPDTPAGRQLLTYIPLDPDAPVGTTGRLDLGRNGSYVVFRQLEQHVQKFWRFLDAKAEHDAQQRKKLGAKMVGRWPNGTPLVHAPDQEPPTFDYKKANDFLYSTKGADGRDDIHGDKCPLGSHIRRTNPRDGQQPGPAGSLMVSDRHRVLRRGRAYGDPLVPSFDPSEIIASDRPDTGRGLHFICFNTDLGRQFEFVQSTWVNSMKFDGLYIDADPLIGPHKQPGVDKDVDPEEVTSFTEQRCPVRHRVDTLPRFVNTRGGAYLFMPSIKAMRYLASVP
jgi:Dyp-type peroxidase family